MAHCLPERHQLHAGVDLLLAVRVCSSLSIWVCRLETVPPNTDMCLGPASKRHRCFINALSKLTGLHTFVARLRWAPTEPPRWPLYSLANCYGITQHWGACLCPSEKERVASPNTHKAGAGGSLELLGEETGWSQPFGILPGLCPPSSPCIEKMLGTARKQQVSSMQFCTLQSGSPSTPWDIAL